MATKKFIPSTKSKCGRCGYDKIQILIGECGHIHYGCTKCKSEWCTHYGEWEWLRKDWRDYIAVERAETLPRKRGKVVK